MSTTTTPRFTTTVEGVRFDFVGFNELTVLGTLDGVTHFVGEMVVGDYGWVAFTAAGADRPVIVERFMTAYMLADKIAPRVAAVLRRRAAEAACA
jgi:hypothetical protein